MQLETQSAEKRRLSPEHRASLRAAWARPEVRERQVAATRAALNRPEVKAKLSAAARAKMASPEARARDSASTRAQWADPAIRAKMIAAIKAAAARPEVKARRAAAAKVANARPEVKARRSANNCMRQPAFRARWDILMHDPEVKRRQSEGVTAALARPEVKAKHAASTRALWADPDFRARNRAAIKAAAPRISASAKRWWASADEFSKARIIAVLNSPESRERSRAALVIKWADPGTRAALVAELKKRWADPVWREKFLAIRWSKVKRDRQSELMKAIWEEWLATLPPEEIHRRCAAIACKGGGRMRTPQALRPASGLRTL